MCNVDVSVLEDSVVIVVVVVLVVVVVAVSYTHLDVYKRQVECKIFNLKSLSV